MPCARRCYIPASTKRQPPTRPNAWAVFLWPRSAHAARGRLAVRDEEFITKFEDCTLAPELFDHRAHVRLAWLYLRESGAPAALARFSENLRRYASAQGAAGLYHETITCAYLFLINERDERAARSQTWDEFAAANPDLLDWRESILKHLYRDETLSSDLARRVFVLPDKLAADD